MVGGSAEIRAPIRAALSATDVEIRPITGGALGVVTVLEPAPGDLVVVEDSPTRGLDALPVVETLRRNGGGVTIVVVAARADPERVEALLRAGASACVIADDPTHWENVAPFLRRDDAAV